MRTVVVPAPPLLETPGERPAAVNSSQHASKIRISETFTSLQGEGQLTGTPSFFIRTSGCNLRCWFCDTPYASWQPEGKRQTVDQLVAAAVGSGVRHVVVTGGEPLIANRIAELTLRLRTASLHVTIETAGTVDPAAPCDLLSLSPKLRRSGPDPAEHPRWAQRHQMRRLPIKVMRGLIASAPNHQIKFVVQSPDELAEIDDLVSQLGVAPETIWLMPEGITIEKIDTTLTWLSVWASSKNYRTSDRAHLRWFGNQRGT